MAVEVLGTDVNAVDEWNSTPLYYACLAGHIDVVKYLIEMGAECEENTYQVRPRMGGKPCEQTWS